ncbi:MAG: protein kinase domain-containing protein [Ignavibacteriaceae bacterium]
MLKVELQKFFDTGFCPEISNVKWFELPDAPFAEGGFGAIYDVNRTSSGNLKTLFVLKIFKPGTSNNSAQGLKTIQALQQKILDKDRQLKSNGKKGVASLPFFDGFPVLSFTGKMKGKLVNGYVTKKLNSIGYSDFDSILADTKLFNELLNQPLSQKFFLAMQFVEGMKILKSCAYVHADINEPNVFIDAKNGRITLIDYDSGALMLTPNDKPTTWGKFCDWTCPEIMKELSSNGNNIVHVDLFTDVWSVAIGIHYIFFGVHPLFYLTNLGVNTVKNYLSNNKWPDINLSDPLFNKANKDAYNNYCHIISQLPAKFVDKLAATINQGYFNPVQRTGYESWELALKAAEEPPKIDFFRCSNTATFETIPVSFTWNVMGFARLFLLSPNGKKTEVTGSNSLTILPYEGMYRLEAHGPFGTDTKSLPLRVWKHPHVETVTVPSPAIRMHRLLIPPIVVPNLINPMPKIFIGNPAGNAFAFALGKVNINSPAQSFSKNSLLEKLKTSCSILRNAFIKVYYNIPDQFRFPKIIKHRWLP